ncbi:hypothetical protein MC378_08110 [Polaribacter sp. MSW13]|uniref:DUF4252 domain-containing protein n=1 Tax=Polaribacter marinus TaxID=2916838 RepID=A0A9X1VMZ0_9FLAO|nr:DUF6702 family protein [Polaribacter marinus]MCI2229127.1 hypothetical protein [Polaribacter marinus]
MRTVLIFYFFCLFSNLGFAHEPNEAFFTYIQKENTVEVMAELPWSMRNALMEFNPSLENSTTKKDFENTFNEYINKNLILKDKKGDLLQFQEFKELESIGHSHQNNYLIIFKGTDLFDITNTFMFNLYDNQINYNELTIDNKTTSFKTEKKSKQFYLNKRSDKNYWYLLILIAPIIYIVNRYTNKKTTANNV